MVRRLKQDLRDIGERDFPERQIIPIAIEGLTSDAPELALSRLLQTYRNCREERLNRPTTHADTRGDRAARAGKYNRDRTFLARSMPSINLPTSMQDQVLVQNPSQSHFVASIVGMAGVVAEGEAEEETVSRVKTVLEAQLETSKLITIEVSQPSRFATDQWLKH
jgi:predicted RNase H-like HicB family nuclease